MSAAASSASAAAASLVASSKSGGGSGGGGGSGNSPPSPPSGVAQCHPIDDEIVKQSFGDLECSICTNVAWDPVSPPCAVHVFCRRCLLEWLTRGNASCPACKRAVSAHAPAGSPDAIQPLALSNPIAYRMLCKIRVYCPRHRHAGCPYKGEYSDALTTHLQRSCAYEPVACPLRCVSSQPVLRGQLAAHVLVCDRRPINCEFCKSAVPANELKSQTHMLVCPGAPVLCSSLFPDGCNQSILRREMNEHRQNACPECLVSCPLAAICGCKVVNVARWTLASHNESHAQQHVKLLLQLVEHQKAVIEQLSATAAAATAASIAGSGLRASTGPAGSSSASRRLSVEKSNVASAAAPAMMSSPRLQLAPAASASASASVASGNGGASAAVLPSGNGGGGGGSGSGSVSSVTQTLRASLASSPLHDNKIALQRSIPANSGGLRDGVLAKSLYVDVRDHVGKWLEAQVVDCTDTRVFVHFLNWEDKWNEWIDKKDADFRLTDFHRFSAGVMTPAQLETFKKDVWVEIYAVRPPPRRWVYAKINKLDGQQIQVTYLVDEKLYQYWFHIQSQEISPLRQQQQQS